MQGTGEMHNSETCWCCWRGWNCVGESLARFRVSLSGTHGRETSTALPVSTSFFLFGFFYFLFFGFVFVFWGFFFCSKTKKVAGLCSRRQEVGLWGLCLLIFCPKAMQGINHLFSLTGSWWDQDRGHSLAASSLMKDRTLLCPEVNPGLGCFLRTPTCPERNLTGWVLLGHSFSQILFWSWKHPWDEPWELFPPAAPTFSAWDQPQEEPTEGCWYEGIC